MNPGSGSKPVVNRIATPLGLRRLISSASTSMGSMMAGRLDFLGDFFILGRILNLHRESKGESVMAVWVEGEIELFPDLLVERINIAFDYTKLNKTNEH